ncbi:arginine--tRNA ligase [Nocardioides halotolerans]|uniref:arginine--tRNA ligase n=1 Tax=Nocardioides halotolerans TaxID=433660 RepID=UPI00042527E1|nr:arginine--tRNA ligase [Nocardioides halotolerans]
MTPEQLSAAIVDVLATLSDEGALTLPDGVPSAVTVERPRQKEHGDYATNVALQLAKKAGLAPRDLAVQIQDRLVKLDDVADVQIAGPGFLNITVAAEAQGVIAEQVVAQGERYGTSETGAGERVNVEFVSANPTGPVTLASARWAAVGDTISRLIEATGSEVAREYYFNDHGAQIDRFANSLLARGKGREVPEDGYQGSYITDIAQQVLAAHPEVADQDDEQGRESMRAFGVPLMFEEIKRTLEEFRVPFDVWFHENDLHESGAVQRAIDRLTELGNIYEKDGAKWLATEKFGDDKDRVIVRSTGQPAYLSGDLAYYLDKRDRGFDRCIILLGADHHGYVRRLMAMCAAFGDEPGRNLEIIIGQMVNLLSHGSVVRMGKRSGNIVTLLDLVEEIGVDAARYALVRNSIETNLDIDIDLWTKATSDNPVFYVQYAHARVSSILRNAAELGLAPEPHAELLTHDKEGDLLRALADFPRVVQAAADLREPHRIARYLEDTAAAYHRFYDNCRVLPMGDEDATDLNRARLVLVDATRTVLANGLALLGVSAPERM